MQGKIVSIDVKQGDAVAAGASVAVLEAMKMEHLVGASVSGRVHSVAGAPGTVLAEGEPLLFLVPEDVAGADARTENAVDPDTIRPDLAESIARHAFQSRRKPSRTRSRAGARPTSARRARTSNSSAIRAASSNMARSPSRRSAAAARSTT